MRISYGTPAQLIRMAKALYKEERVRKDREGWFRLLEIRTGKEAEYGDLPAIEREGKLLTSEVLEMPLELSGKQIFAGTQAAAFSRAKAAGEPGVYAFAPAMRFEPASAFDDLVPNDVLTRARIGRVRYEAEHDDCALALEQVKQNVSPFAADDVFTLEPALGRVVPDMRFVLKNGIGAALSLARERLRDGQGGEERRSFYRAAIYSLEAALVLAGRYMAVVLDAEYDASGVRKNQMARLRRTLAKVPEKGAETLYEAIQSFILIWQTMGIEQSPNPVAFSAGCLDRLFEPYRAAEKLPRDQAAALFSHLLVFFNVGPDARALWQSVAVGGRDAGGNDLTNECTYALLDAFYEMNLPQPLLSVRVDRGMPQALYGSLNRFFQAPGRVTPSLYCDEHVFAALEAAGVNPSDAPDYAVVGDRTAAVMGKDGGGSADARLNLNGMLALARKDGGANARALFYEKLDGAIEALARAAGDCRAALALRPTPFLSALMGGLDAGCDLRGAARRCAPYGAGGLAVVGLASVSGALAALDGAGDPASEAAEIIRRVGRLLGEGLYRPDFYAAPFGEADALAGVKAVDGGGLRALAASDPALARVLGETSRHVFIDPEQCADESGEALKARVVAPAFYGDERLCRLTVGAVTPRMVAQVVKAPGKYAPDGVFMMRTPELLVNLAGIRSEARDALKRGMDAEDAGR